MVLVSLGAWIMVKFQQNTLTNNKYNEAILQPVQLSLISLPSFYISKISLQNYEHQIVVINVAGAINWGAASNDVWFYPHSQCSQFKHGYLLISILNLSSLYPPSTGI